MIGLFGGSFDPPHKAHLQCITLFWNNFPNSRMLYVVPNSLSPLKSEKHTSEEDVKNMIDILIKESGFNNTFSSDFELKKKGKSFTIDTINYFKEKYTNDEIGFIIGSDNLQNFLLWKEYERILTLVKLLVVPRLGFSNEIPEKLFPWTEKIIFLKNDFPLSINSTSFRKREKSSEEILTSGVLKYIKDMELYGY